MPELDLSPLQSRLIELSPQGRAGMLPALQAVQAMFGYIPQEAAEAVGKSLGVPLVDVYGVIEFYTMLYSQPVGRIVFQVCTDPPCQFAGGEGVLQSVCRQLGLHPGETSADGATTVERATCLGLCAHAPAALSNSLIGEAGPSQIAIGNANTLAPAQLIHFPGPQPATPVYGERRLTVRCGMGRPIQLPEYEETGGYQGLRKALEMEPSAVISEVKSSGLVGRGGAAFPTGVKWEGAALAPGETRYVVCNADESEPGTFKDRVLMEDDPHQVIEGLIIAGWAIGAGKGYIYVRGEYLNAYHALQDAVEEASGAGYLGKNVLGTNFNFDIELRLGAGAYICGEETALFESIEGKRGFPRLKPPFPTTYGLFGKPTAINNVETLCNIPFIVDHGHAKFRRLGTDKSPGTKLLCLSGDVARPGLYEVPFGISLRYLIEELGGGPNGGRDLQAVLLGGAAGAFATPEQLDLEISFEGLKQANLPLGSGVVMVIGKGRDLRSILLGLAHFFAHESCGKCYPCQIGTQRQYEILQRLGSGKSLPGDFERLSDIGWTMSDASICGLGQTAASAVLSAMNIWPELFR